MLQECHEKKRTGKRKKMLFFSANDTQVLEKFQSGMAATQESLQASCCRKKQKQAARASSAILLLATASCG